MLLDKALLAKMELLFQDTQARVITAVKVRLLKYSTLCTGL
jgi:hypothetical protein